PSSRRPPPPAPRTLPGSSDPSGPPVAVAASCEATPKRSSAQPPSRDGGGSLLQGSIDPSGGLLHGRHGGPVGQPEHPEDVDRGGPQLPGQRLLGGRCRLGARACPQGLRRGDRSPQRGL